MESAFDCNFVARIQRLAINPKFLWQLECQPIYLSVRMFPPLVRGAADCLIQDRMTRKEGRSFVSYALVNARAGVERRYNSGQGMPGFHRAMDIYPTGCPMGQRANHQFAWRGSLSFVMMAVIRIAGD